MFSDSKPWRFIINSGKCPNVLSHMKKAAGDCPGQTDSPQQEHIRNTQFWCGPWVEQAGGRTWRKSSALLKFSFTAHRPQRQPLSPKAFVSRSPSNLTSSSASPTCVLSILQKLTRTFSGDFTRGLAGENVWKQHHGSKMKSNPF